LPAFAAAATPSASPTGTPQPQVSTPPATSYPTLEEAAPGDFGSVVIAPGAGAFVYCAYGGSDSRLKSLLVTEPLITITNEPEKRSRLRRVTYQAEVESNSLESVFSADWAFLAATETQARSTGRNQGARFDPVLIKVDVGDLTASSVVRVAIVIHWIGTQDRRLASQRLYPTSYAPLGDNEIDPVPEGCPTHT
jgi:hypothetical protein